MRILTWLLAGVISCLAANSSFTRLDEGSAPSATAFKDTRPECHQRVGKAGAGVVLRVLQESRSSLVDLRSLAATKATSGDNNGASINQASLGTNVCISLPWHKLP